MHTGLKKPSHNELFIVKEVAEISQRIVVMAYKAVELLRDHYGIQATKIVVIPHGVPECRYDRETTRKELGWADRQVMLTFGFVGRHKGIETVIEALDRKRTPLNS